MNSVYAPLKSFSSVATPVAAIVAALVAIWVKVDDAHHQTVINRLQEEQLKLKNDADRIASETQQKLADLNEKAKNIAIQTGTIEASLKSMEVRERTENASYKFAEEFLAYIRDNRQQFAKSPQIAVAALSIIAEASSDTSGNSDPVSRKVMPVKMALLLNDPGSVAATDPSLKLIPNWWDTAFWAEDDSIQATAMKALCAICRAAIRDERQLNLPLAAQCVEAIDALRRRLLEKESGFADRGANLCGDGESAPRLTAVRIRLEALTEVGRIYSDVRDREGWKDNPVQAGILSQLAAAFGDLQQLQNRVSVTSGEKRSGEAQVDQQALEKAQDVVDAVQSNVEQQKITANEPQTVSQRITDLIKQLADPQDEVRARIELALQGQNAVKPLLHEVEKQHDGKTNADYKTQLGIARALSQMRQPITLDNEDARRAVSLIGAKKLQTRLAAETFLVNLKSEASLQNCFHALQRLFEEQKSTPQDGNAVYYAAEVMAKWASVITPETKISAKPENSGSTEPMASLCLRTAREWQKQLKESPNATEWASTITRIDKLLERVSPLSPVVSADPLPEETVFDKKKATTEH
jgi:hypothetical protein